MRGTWRIARWLSVAWFATITPPTAGPATAQTATLDVTLTNGTTGQPGDAACNAGFLCDDSLAGYRVCRHVGTGGEDQGCTTMQNDPALLVRDTIDAEAGGTVGTPDGTCGGSACVGGPTPGAACIEDTDCATVTMVIP